LDSDVIYGYHPGINFAQDTLLFPEFLKFLEHNELKEDCSVPRTCIERIITKRDIAIINDPEFISNVAREMGTDSVGKLICSFDKSVASGGITVPFKK
jgi:hypothetical protein